MIITKKKIVFKAFGLSVISDIMLPELPQLSIYDGSIDIEIKIQDLSEQWNDLSCEKDNIVIKKNLVMFQAPNIATFSIQNGNKILVSPLEEFDEDMTRLWILGTCMGALLLQRKTLPLHGSAVAIDGKAYAIIGDSGAGKSTLASAFINSGFQLLTDDVIAVTLSEDNIPIVTPSYPQQKLWQDSIENFGMDTHQYKSIFGRENKYCVPVSSQFQSSPLQLAGVFELIKSGESNEIHISQIEKLDRFHSLYRNTFRNFLIQGLGLIDWHFHTSVKVAEKVELFQLRRPVLGFNAHHLVSTILSTIKKGE